MGLVKKCISLLRLQQKFPGRERRDYPDIACAESNVMRYLKSWNKDLKHDEYGNLYLIKPGTVLLNAHMDTVQKEDDAALAPKIYLDNEGKIHGDNIIIGGDDKCGIAIAMEMYERYPDKVSLLFTRQEETGCNGARYFCEHSPDLVSQCKYCLTLDRRGNKDIISNMNQYCSMEFQNDLVRVGKEGGFDYEPERGLCSDANHISKIINAVNLSVGYYNPHSKAEYIVADDLKKAFNYVEYIVDNLNGDWPIYVAPKVEYKYYQEPVGGGRGKSPSLYGYGRGLFDDDRESRYEKKKEYKQPKREFVSLTSPKGKDTRTEDQKYTASFFLIGKDGLLSVRKDIFFYDEDMDQLIEVPAGIYTVDARDDEDDEDERVDLEIKKASSWSKYKKKK